ncbi:hypothetical protein [uncultured Pseudomonas sp.]|uniref:hypothetical protein n=1 Tax=uncultured Pseudomonas sp. TaxID=114707 RepID=UPI0025E9D7A9|nr:hypothetical protein [uncultured Pseudomonas sp.]
MNYVPFPEKDWKHLSKIHDAAIERLFEQIFAEARQVMQIEGLSAREQVWKTKNIIDEGIKDIRLTFDALGFSRSKAGSYLIALYARNALTEEDVAGFSEATQERLARWRDSD